MTQPTNSPHEPGTVNLVAIDGTDALAYVIIRPGSGPGHALVEAGANGITKKQGAAALRQIADQWDPR
jgi:hypothetical protein